MGSGRGMNGEINIIQTSKSFMNVIKNKSIGYEIAEDWMLFWTFFMPLALTLNILSKDTILIYKGLLYILPVFAFTVIRRNITGSFKYLLANVIIVFFVFIISFTLIEKIVLLIPIILCSIISMKKRRCEVIEFYKISTFVWCEGLMVICYFVAMNYKLSFMMSLINLTSINVALTFILYECTSRMACFMQWEGEFIKGYSKRMTRVKLGSIAFISAAIGFFILLAYKIGLYKLFDMLTSKILAFFNATRASDGQAEKIKPAANVQPQNLTNSLKDLGAKSESNHLITAILNIVQLIIYVILAVVVIYLLVHLFINIKNFYKGLSMRKTYKREKREFVISLDDVVTQIRERATSLRVKLELPFNVTNNKKIRKIYHKLIKSYRVKGFSAYNFNTPIEIESNVKEILKKNISEATAIYERARYNDLECSKEEVDRMRSFLKL